MLEILQPNNYIKITRSDDHDLDMAIVSKDDGTPYTMVEGDTLKFTVKEGVNSTTKLIEKTSTTPNFSIVSSDTSNLAFKKYVYDVELIKADGKKDTIITKSTFEVTEEVG